MKYDWQKDFEAMPAVEVLKAAEDFNPSQYKVMLQLLNIFIKRVMLPKCMKCWGKGWGTSMYGFTIAPDFFGDKRYTEAPSVHLIFCDCERGKQLEMLVEKNQ